MKIPAATAKSLTINNTTKHLKIKMRFPRKAEGRHLEQRGPVHCDSQGKEVTKVNSSMQ
ncbi:hypothetical protein Nmel_015551 [Mimus melanotis]